MILRHAGELWQPRSVRPSTNVYKGQHCLKWQRIVEGLHVDLERLNSPLETPLNRARADMAPLPLPFESSPSPRILIQSRSIRLAQISATSIEAAHLREIGALSLAVIGVVLAGHCNNHWFAMKMAPSTVN